MYVSNKLTELLKEWYFWVLETLIRIFKKDQNIAGVKPVPTNSPSEIREDGFISSMESLTSLDESASDESLNASQEFNFRSRKEYTRFHSLSTSRLGFYEPTIVSPNIVSPVSEVKPVFEFQQTNFIPRQMRQVPQTIFKFSIHTGTSETMKMSDVYSKPVVSEYQDFFMMQQTQKKRLYNDLNRTAYL